jgi:spermidine synthase
LKPWQEIARAPIPATGGCLSLHQRGGEFSLRAGAEELMNSRVHGSEEALAQRACEAIAGRPYPRLLVGGLGMGYTLAATLALLGPEARVEVAEIIPEVVEWNRTLLADLAGRPLADPRVEPRVADVVDLLSKSVERYDAILLDVDNGPTGVTTPDNDRLYGARGLSHAWRSLKKGGVLAVWSAGPDERFVARLKRAGFSVSTRRVGARGAQGGRAHTIWLASKPL